ncbi:MAG: winged helix-turn-helix transcriptional regulator [Halosimplex sp.]
MSRADRGQDQPRAMIHRRILDVAASDPDASLTAIADDVSGASPDLVERVLDEYGDPCRESESAAQTDQTMDATNPSAPESDPDSGSEPTTESDDESTTDGGGEPTIESDTESSTDGDAPPAVDLSEKQRRTLRALYERPGASQGDLAEDLDVTRATISRRLNGISGFEWKNRRAFAEAVFGGDGGSESDDPDADSSESVARERVDDLDEGSGDDGDADETVDPETVDREGGPEDAETGGYGVEPGDASGSTIETEQPALDAIGATLANLEHRIEAIESRTDGGGRSSASASLPPELAHKVVHACMESDRVSEDEELELLRTFMVE